MELIHHLPAALSSWVTALNVFIFIIIRVMRGCLLPLPDSKPLERMNASPRKSSFSSHAYLSLPTISGFVNCLGINRHLDFPSCASGKESTCQCRRHETQVQSLGGEEPLEEEMATPSSILAWRSPWTEEPDGLWSTGSQRVNHYCSDLACMHV